MASVMGEVTQDGIGLFRFYCEEPGEALLGGLSRFLVQIYGAAEGHLVSKTVRIEGVDGHTSCRDQLASSLGRRLGEITVPEVPDVIAGG